MVDESLEYDESTEDILEKISALAKGFLIVRDQDPEKTCSFCRGLLILLNKLQEIKSENT
jgi:hypothetical protein